MAGECRRLSGFFPAGQSGVPMKSTEKDLLGVCLVQVTEKELEGDE